MKNPAHRRKVVLIFDQDDCCCLRIHWLFSLRFLLLFALCRGSIKAILTPYSARISYRVFWLGR
jgi:hypothetical protein